MHFLLNIVHTHTYLLLQMRSSVLCRWSPWKTSCDANILSQIFLPPGHLLRGHNTFMLARSSGIGRQLIGQELSIRLKLQPGSSASNLLIFYWWSVSELYDFFEQDSNSFISNSNSFDSNCPRKERGKDLSFCRILQNSAEFGSAENLQNSTELFFSWQTNTVSRMLVSPVTRMVYTRLLPFQHVEHA